MKLAFFTPLNPQPSGISDYSEELLPHLAARAEVDLFVDGFAPTSREIAARFRVFDYRRDPSALRLLDTYDAVVYHLGNDHRYHARILEVMRAHPGVAVFHDFALQDFFLGLARERGDARVYLEEVEACHGAEARREAEEALARGATPAAVALPTEFPLNRRAARAAEGIIVHSEWSRARFQRIAPGVPIARINMPVKPNAEARPAHEDEAARDEVTIATFGLVTPGKGIERTLRALAALSNRHRFRYTLVGATNHYFDVAELVRESGLGGRVHVTGHVTLAEFERLIAETDIAVNIRERTVGETSASLCRIMAAGVASVVSNVGWYAELPDDSVVKIDLDGHADAMLEAYLSRLVEDAALRRRIGANARRHVLAEHDLERGADAYVAFIRETIAGRSRRRFVGGVSAEIGRLGAHSSDEKFIRSVASEVALLAPAATTHAAHLDPHTNGDGTSPFTNTNTNGDDGDATSIDATPNNTASIDTTLTGASKMKVAVPDNTKPGATFDAAPLDAKAGAARVAPTNANVASTAEADDASMEANSSSSTHGRTPKIEDVDYKRAAREYLGRLSDERQHHLRTKPFYNLAHKPARYKNDGLDEDSHRHLCDFANMAVTLALAPGARLLDVGCGSGWLSEYFARLGYDVRGIDISPALVEMARERVAGVPYGVDHETPLRCSFEVHDIEVGPLAEKFDAVVCYDALHHFEDERAVFRHLSAMLDVGGQLFILEGERPPALSPSEEELREVMREFGTLESPFDPEYLRALLDENGLAVVGDYVSVNGLFERALLEGDRLPLSNVATNYHYLVCKKVIAGARASTVPDSRRPNVLRAHITTPEPLPESFSPGAKIETRLALANAGDTLWLTGQSVRAGLVMPALRIFDAAGRLVSERHGPLLARAVAPGETVTLRAECTAPARPGAYTLKVDLVDQHVCWFEARGSEPLVIKFEVD